MCLRKMCLMAWKRTFYGNVYLSTTCQCPQLRLNPLSTQINICCLMTNQTPALLVQRARWTRAAVMLLQSLYFSRPLPPSPPTPSQSYNPRRPSVRSLFAGGEGGNHVSASRKEQYVTFFLVRSVRCIYATRVFLASQFKNLSTSFHNTGILWL